MLLLHSYNEYQIRMNLNYQPQMQIEFKTNRDSLSQLKAEGHVQIYQNSKFYKVIF